MRLQDKLVALRQMIAWRMFWKWRNIDYRCAVPDNPKFMTAREAAAKIPDGAVLATSGLGGNAHATVMYWAIRDQFLETGHPCNLTLVSTGGQGGRGLAPGTVETLGEEGLITRFFTGHTETFKAMLKLADKGKLELQCIPQGTLALLLAEMGEGRNWLVNETGIGTFMDPRIGRGTPVLGNAPQYVSVENDKLRYEVPPVNVAVFNAPAADRKGNIYVKNCAMIAESYEIAKAAKKNGGYVIANVGLLVDEGYDEIFLPAEDIDAVVCYPWTEQSMGIKHSKPWPPFTLDSDWEVERAAEFMMFINNIIRITPRRTPVDFALGRLAATIFAEEAHPGCSVDIGIGLPEIATRLLREGGLLDKVRVMTESGVSGGMPANGVFFGAAACPTEIVSSAEAFRRIYKGLDVAILGALEFDLAGNVNVSKRGEGAIHYVGPGGFIDITTNSDLIIFCSAWSHKGQLAMQNGRINVLSQGKPKLVEQVAEVTFNGAEALKAGKRIFYVTPIAAFRLTERGLELYRVMPGIDVQRDILDAAPQGILLPESGEVPVAAPEVASGVGFKLDFTRQ